MKRLWERGIRQGGFTLAELVVVVAIIGLLLAIAVPLYIGFTDEAKDTADAANARTAQVTTAGNQALAP